MITHGRPWASIYGFGDVPLRVDLKHVYANHTDSPALLVPTEEQINNYAGGPPYMSTRRDMFAIVNIWCELVPRVHHVYQALLGELYGWSLAAAHLRLPHTLATSFMISATGIRGEGWPLIDQLKDDEVCEFSTSREKEVKLPYVVHYSQSYWLGKWFIGKYRLEKEFLSCEKPLLLEPPMTIHQSRWEAIRRKDENRSRYCKTGAVHDLPNNRSVERCSDVVQGSNVREGAGKLRKVIHFSSQFRSE
ncbi:hypothetical protein ACHAXA_006497 [Cyclostephanos tholiformis]|uniref:Uncharacterized protein n=1 Tax=Cyclostephanos tholiformis TaxID=382380 RepID=A0ABD3RZH9_9STRA